MSAPSQMVHLAAQRAMEGEMLDRVEGARTLAPALHHLLTKIADAGGELRPRKGAQKERFAEAVVAAANLKGLIRRDPDGPLGFMEGLILTKSGWQAIGRQPPPTVVAMLWAWFLQCTGTRRGRAA